MTPLIYAIDHNKVSIVRYLIKKGVDINKKYNNKSPLVYAIKKK